MTWLNGRTLRIGSAVCGVALAAGAIVTACSSDSDSNPGPTTTYGTPVTVGNGVARTYLVTTDGSPTEIGIALSQASLEGVPTAPVMGGYEYVLPLPAGNTTQYQVVGLNWNPTGHPPPMVYTVPHFDFHFYMISAAGRSAIVPTDPDFGAKAANLPTAEFSISGYRNDPPTNTVPGMGLHWADPTSPEFHGTPFTRTFIEGSWNGQFIFYEPMVTKAYLEGHPDDLVTVGSASSHAISGYYPAAYRVKWDAENSEWRVGLASLKKY